MTIDTADAGLISVDGGVETVMRTAYAGAAHEEVSSRVLTDTTSFVSPLHPVRDVVSDVPVLDITCHLSPTLTNDDAGRPDTTIRHAEYTGLIST